MKTLLQQLYSGEIHPSEKIVVRTPAYKALNQKISAEMEYFMSLLSAKDRERFDDLEGLELERSSAYAFEHFVYGFRLGIGLMMETLDPSSIRIKN